MADDEGCGHAEGARHDCAYVEWRSALVPVAESRADAEVGREPKSLDRPTARDWAERWDRAFHRHMEEAVQDPFFRLGAPGFARREARPSGLRALS